MLEWLRRRREGADPIDLRPRDCHCHVIPGVDDGSRDMAESMAMLRLLHEAGAEHVVATPHILPGRFDNEPDDLRQAFDALTDAAARLDIPVQLELGAEHYLGEALQQRVRDDEVLAFGRERYVLFETPTSHEPPVGLRQLVYALVDRGYTPLIAHVERYPYLRNEGGEELIEDLRAAGARFQVNRTVGGANRPGHGTRGRFIAWLRERDFIDEVGSDLHRATPEGRPYARAAG